MKVGNPEIQIKKLDNKGWMGWICVGRGGGEYVRMSGR
jgi:hypothetical protein